MAVALGLILEALPGGGAEVGAVELLVVGGRRGAELVVEFPDAGAFFEAADDVVVPQVARVHHRQAELLLNDPPPRGDGGRESRFLRAAGEVAGRSGLEFPQVGALGRTESDLAGSAAASRVAVAGLGDADVIALQGDAFPFHPEDLIDGHPRRQDEKEAQVHRGGVGDEVLPQPLLLLGGEEDDGCFGAALPGLLGPVRGGAFAPAGSEAEDAPKERDHGADSTGRRALGAFGFGEGLDVLCADVRPLPERRQDVVLEEQTVVRHASGGEGAGVGFEPGGGELGEGHGGEPYRMRVTICLSTL